MQQTTAKEEVQHREAMLRNELRKTLPPVPPPERRDEHRGHRGHGQRGGTYN